MSRYDYFNRDLSWLSFNERILNEAADKGLPLYERINFMAIYASNLDEFYRVRVSSYKRLSELSVVDKRSLSEDPDKVLRSINQTVDGQLTEFRQIFNEDIIPELKKHNIILIRDEDLAPEHLKFTEKFFYDILLPHTQPILLLKKLVKPFLQNNAIYLAVKLYKKKSKKEIEQKNRKARHAIVKIPSHRFNRFIRLPDLDGKHYIMFLDDVVRLHVKVLFPGYKIDSLYSFMLNRDADLLIEDEFSGDLIEKIETNLSKRETGIPSRFLFDEKMPNDFLKFLKQTFNLSPNDVVKGGRYHNFADFFRFPNPLSPKLDKELLHPLRVKELGRTNSIFKSIRKDERILHFPYQSYEYVIRFLNEAAIDPKVEEIKITQYRVAENSAVVNALINIARNGKRVTVFVEVKARFDEASNISSAREMRKAGIKIIYSIPGLKVHSKVALVLRKTGKESFAFLSTGNFNESTAKVYADHGFFTSDEVIIDELKQMFSYLEDRNQSFVFKRLLISKFNMRESFIELIDREIENVKNGGKGYILLKMNGLQDKGMIKNLYKASEAGVVIDLIVRGICCLNTGKSYSKNIRVIRIVDRFLEHARVFLFYGNGANEVYLSSADWMTRNLNHRIECAFPINNEQVKQELMDILQIQLSDNTSARLLDSNLSNIPLPQKPDEPIVRAQYAIYDYLKSKQDE